MSPSWRSRIFLAFCSAIACALSSPSGAACGPSIWTWIHQLGSDGTETGVDSPAGASSIHGDFWALGFGDPLPGAGHDNGTYPAFEPPHCCEGWLINPFPNVRPYLNGTWNDSRVDGCAVLPPVPQPAKMVVAFSDATPSIGYFNVSCAMWDELWSFNFDDSLDGDPPHGDITLAPIPRIVELRCSRSAETVNYTLNHRALVGGIQPGNCGSAIPLVTGYRVYWRAVPRGSAPPMGRDRDLWNLLSGPVPLGTNAEGTLPSMPNDDLYLAATLVFDSGFETTHVSESAFTSQCSTILADPPSNNIWRLKRSAATTQVE